VFSAGFLLVVLLLVAPLAAYLPMAVMAALLFIIAWGLIDLARIREIVRIGRSEALVLTVTFFATLLVQLEFAILVGVLCSLFAYLNRTTHPAIHAVAPDPASPQRRFIPVAASGSPGRLAECPQLALLRVDGSLFFGAVDHVQDELEAIRRGASARAHILLIGSGINFIDVAGAELLAQEAEAQRAAGGALYLCNLKPTVVDVLERAGLVDRIGRDRIFATKEEAIRGIYPRLDSAICRASTARIFVECQTHLPDGSPRQPD
jgi:SulP family sulfate permease